MDAHDRENVEMNAIEELLGRALNRNREADAEACPGPDVLAAYRDDHLSADERGNFETHLADCWHCQSVLAGLLSTETQPAEAEEFAIPAAAASPTGSDPAMTEKARFAVLAEAAGLTASALPATQAPPPTGAVIVRAASVSTVGPVVARTAKLPRAARPEPGWFARHWAATASLAGLAVAATLLFAFVRPGQRHPGTNEVALNTSPPATATPAAAPPTAATPNSLPPTASGETVESPSTSASSNGSAPKQSEEKKRSPEEKPADTAATDKLSATARPADARNEQTRRADESARASDSATAAAPPAPPRAPQGAVNGSPQERATSQAQAQSGTATGDRYGVVGGAAGSAGMVGRAAKTAPEAPPRILAGAKSSAGYSAANRKAPAAQPAPLPAENTLVTAASPASALALVRTAEPAFLWRVGPAGRIERSSDSGATWTPQSSGVTADLSAGSAPTAKICWLVGADATILRTIDGEHWTKISSPAPVAWVRIFAVDADEAVITSAEGKRYVTSDGGRTWQPQ